jgi:1-acyl-sn-glycerol-3-phosphate acyltransferase
MLSAQATNVLAAGALAALAAGLAALAVVQWRRLGITPLQGVFYAANCLITRVLWRTEIRGRFPIPPGQGAVIVCNHRTSLDPSYIQLAVGPRVVHWLVAKEYFRQPGFGWFLRFTRAIPVSRGGSDTAATKMAIRCAEAGGLVGLFPEGRINETADLLLPGRPGFALIALKARVPVVPCYCRGAPYHGTPLDPLLTPAHVELVIGKPIDLSAYCGRESDREAWRELTLRLLREIAALAGQPDFQPRLAGRSYKSEPE